MGATAAVCIFLGALAGSKIELRQLGNEVFVSTTLTGLPAGPHGFHIHESGDLGNDCDNAGPHYNPDGVDHGDPNSTEPHHKGDLGNFEVTGTPTSKNESFSFFTLDEVIGRAFVVHEKADDLGRGGNNESLKTGNAGKRLDCCVIGLTEWNDWPTTCAAVSLKYHNQVWMAVVLMVAVFGGRAISG